MKISKGFTLIELLVVIAIIGILSSVVLASLTTARAKGQDAAVQSQLSAMRSQAELYYSSNGNKYMASGTATNCGSDLFTSATASGSLLNLVAGVSKSTGGTAPSCYADANKWAFSVALPSGGTFCADNTGKSASTTLSTDHCL